MELLGWDRARLLLGIGYYCLYRRLCGYRFDISGNIRWIFFCAFLFLLEARCICVLIMGAVFEGVGIYK